MTAYTTHAAQDSPDENRPVSAACSRLVTGGKDINDPVDMRKLPADWATQAGRLRNKINPNPESDAGGTPADALGYPSCGADGNTLGKGRLGCSSFTMCADPSGDCRCSVDRNAAQANMQVILARSATTACASTHCAEGTAPKPHGMACTCDSGESSAGTNRPPRPMPTAINALFTFDATKSFAPTRATWASAPLSTAVTDIVRAR